ncbi:MAG: GTP-binding protein, partial [Candidatus Lokiarchaeota archaeon]|nr:GTP-binding protein [Candidatus Lokiarchaeota archaeon]
MKTIVNKIVVGGDGGVGKTTFLHRYCTNVFLADTRLTVGVDFLNKIVPFGDLVFNFAIWDLGGQDQFRFILKSYVRGAHAGLLFFALDRVQSFMSLDEWTKLLRSEKPELPLVLIATKADLEDKEMSVPDEDIQAFIKRHGILAYFRTSSKTGENISKPIEVLAEYFHGKYK